MKLVIEVDTDKRQFSPGRSADNRYFSHLFYKSVAKMLEEKYELTIGEACGWQDGKFVNGKYLLDVDGNKVGHISI